MEYLGGFIEEKYTGDTFSKGPRREDTINVMNIGSHPGSKSRDGFPHLLRQRPVKCSQNTMPS